ncbi:MAG: hypothetical protein N3A66_04835 [Planctomycetota bacterium]|nr:hypothetical protein [Planctomycetota bacterium]
MPTSTQASPLPPANWQPSAPAFPWLPVGIWGGAVFLFLLICAIPLWQKTETGGGGYGAWQGYTLAGRGIITMELIHPRSPQGQRLAEIVGEEYLAVALTIDNSRGQRPLRLDLRQARLYTSAAQSIAALSLPAGTAARLGEIGFDSAKDLEIAGGAAPALLAIFFPRRETLAQIEYLYALQFILDGEICNLQGIYYRRADKAPPLERKQSAIAAPRYKGKDWRQGESRREKP